MLPFANRSLGLSNDARWSASEIERPDDFEAHMECQNRKAYKAIQRFGTTLLFHRADQPDNPS